MTDAASPVRASAAIPDVRRGGDGISHLAEQAAARLGILEPDWVRRTTVKEGSASRRCPISPASEQ